jgi:hypothetical protein
LLGRKLCPRLCAGLCMRFPGMHRIPVKKRNQRYCCGGVYDVCLSHVSKPGSI